MCRIFRGQETNLTGIEQEARRVVEITYFGWLDRRSWIPLHDLQGYHPSQHLHLIQSPFHLLRHLIYELLRLFVVLKSDTVLSNGRELQPLIGQLYSFKTHVNLTANRLPLLTTLQLSFIDTTNRIIQSLSRCFSESIT